MRSGLIRRASLVFRVTALAVLVAVIVLAPPRPQAAAIGPTPDPAASPSSRPEASGLATSPATSSGATIAPILVSPSPDPLARYRAPALERPLASLDPGLVTRGPRPTLAQLRRYQTGNPVFITRSGATATEWELARPDAGAVRGYADQISVIPGQDVGFHLSGRDRLAQVDVFRVGAGDARHVLTIPDVPVSSQPEAAPRSSDGLVQETWPRSTTMHVPADWQSGVYLVKLTGNSGGQSYILFVVRPERPTGLTLVLPTMTYAAYNDYGGTDLYAWEKGPRSRAYAVSFDRPFSQAWGAGLFFRLDFPLIVWLEDHGYAPGYVTDVDLDRDPGLGLGATTLLFSGHGEYWTGGMRDTVEAAAAGGTNLGFFGANQAFWQVRLEPADGGRQNPVVVCYKVARLDPVAAARPSEATVRFEEPPVNRPPSSLMGMEYAGEVTELQPMVVGAGITTFDPTSGLKSGQELPGLIGGEVDEPERSFSGVLLGATPVIVTQHAGTVTAGMSLWVGAAGNNVFDAGTFDFSWGLDPRYAAALPGFPADDFGNLVARVLAWLGAQPAL